MFAFSSIVGQGFCHEDLPWLHAALPQRVKHPHEDVNCLDMPTGELWAVGVGTGLADILNCLTYFRHDAAELCGEKLGGEPGTEAVSSRLITCGESHVEHGCLLIFVEPVRHGHRGAQCGTVVERVGYRGLDLWVGNKFVYEGLGLGGGHVGSLEFTMVCQSNVLQHHVLP